MIRSYTKISETRSEKSVRANLAQPLISLTQEQLAQVLDQATKDFHDQPGWILNGICVRVRGDELRLDLVKQRQEDK